MKGKSSLDLNVKRKKERIVSCKLYVDVKNGHCLTYEHDNWVHENPMEGLHIKI